MNWKFNNINLLSNKCFDQFNKKNIYIQVNYPKPFNSSVYDLKANRLGLKGLTNVDIIVWNHHLFIMGMSYKNRNIPTTVF